jgi:hypothetical protein
MIPGIDLFFRFTSILPEIQSYGVPVWFYRAAPCDETLLFWLVENGIMPPTVDSYVTTFNNV